MKSTAITLSLSMLLVLVTGCIEEVPADAKPANIRKPVKLHQVTSSGIENIRTFPGEILASEHSNLSFRVSGELQQVLVTEGDDVVKGQVLARLDATDYRLQVEQAQANYQLAQSQYQRLQSITNLDAATAAQLDEAQAGLAQAKVGLQRTENQLAYTELKAPYDGTIAQLYFDNSEFIAAGQTMVSLISLDQLDVRFQIPSDIVAEVNKTEKAAYQPNISFDVIPGQRFPARIKSFIANADPGTRSYAAILTLPKPDDALGFLLPGMNATLYLDINKIIDQTHRGPMIPVEALFSHGNDSLYSSRKSVWLYNPQTQQVQRQPVEHGYVQSDQVEILDGLNQGDQVVVSGVHALFDGQNVKPWQTGE